MILTLARELLLSTSDTVIPRRYRFTDHFDILQYSANSTKWLRRAPLQICLPPQEPSSSIPTQIQSNPQTIALLNGLREYPRGFLNLAARFYHPRPVLQASTRRGREQNGPPDPCTCHRFLPPRAPLAHRVPLCHLRRQPIALDNPGLRASRHRAHQPSGLTLQGRGRYLCPYLSKQARQLA